MSASLVSSSNLHPHYVLNLILILHRANAHHYHIAARNRANLHPTHHAWKEARRRGLTVDVDKATRCDQKQISLVPLPILDTSVTPVDLMQSTSIILQSPSLDVIRMYSQELTRLDGISPLKRRPTLKCAIPGVFTRTTPNGTTAAITLSSASHLSSISLTSPIAHSAVLKRKLVTSARSSSIRISGRRSSMCSAALINPTVTISATPEAQEWQPLDVPIDEEDIDWGLDDITDMGISPSPLSDCGSDSASSGTHCSSEPLTPSDEGPIMIRLKRKSVEVCSITDNFEKRPKFDQQEWVHPATPHKNVIPQELM